MGALDGIYDFEHTMYGRNWSIGVSHAISVSENEALLLGAAD